MAMKTRRQMRIMELIRNNVVETQEQLAQLLKEENIRVTQATVSRDIKEMRLIKVPTGDGRYRYALPDEAAVGGRDERIIRIFRECVLSYDYSHNIVVINTLAATAQGVAEAIDSLGADEVIGSLAGERTVFVVIRPAEAVPTFLERIRQMLG